MRCLGLVLTILLVLACNETRADEKMGEENKKDIAELQKLLEKTVKVDSTDLFTKHNKLNDQAIDLVTKTLEYTDKNVDELKTHLETRIKDFNENHMNNLKELEMNTKEMLLKMNKTIMTNLENINTKSMEERNEIIWWQHHRAHLHEDILKTRITACAFDHGHFGKGIVNYKGIDGGYIAESVSIRVYNKTDIKEEDVLNLDTGIFKVPVNAAGEYIFTFTVTIDSFDQKRMPSSYFFVKNGDKIAGTEIYSNVGTRHDHDRAPGSRQIFLKLVENDEISVEQTRATDIQDFHVSFCGALLHLEKASESPGGMFDDATNPEFVSGTLAEQETWEYEFLGLNASEPIEYKYGEKDKKPDVKKLFDEAKIQDTEWKTDKADWTGTNTN